MGMGGGVSRYAQHDGAAPTWYEASARTNPTWPALDGDARADVCVIGGGYTGLSCALHLAERGYRVVLLEARCIGNGASGRNGGQLGSGHRRDQFTLERELGEERARLLWSHRRGGQVARARSHCPARDRMRPQARHRHRRPPAAPRPRAGPRSGASPRALRLRPDPNYWIEWRCAAEVASEDFHGGLLDQGCGPPAPPRLCAGPRLGGGGSGCQKSAKGRL